MSSEQWKIDNADKMRQYRNEWYAKNKKHARTKVIERRTTLKEWLRKYKSTLSCTRCPENHPGTLQFHHIDPKQKDINVGVAVKNGWSIERIEKEISKCIVLCANCHAKEHYKDYGSQVLR